MILPSLYLEFVEFHTKDIFKGSMFGVACFFLVNLSKKVFVYVPLNGLPLILCNLVALSFVFLEYQVQICQVHILADINHNAI